MRFYCMKCKEFREVPDGKFVKDEKITEKGKVFVYKAICEKCGTKMSRISRKEQNA